MPLEQSAWAPQTGQRSQHRFHLRHSSSDFSGAIHYDKYDSFPRSTPTTTYQPENPPDVLARDELTKLWRLIRRLRWKAASLLCSFERAAGVGRHWSEHSIAPFPQNLNDTGVDANHEALTAETMFKLDFFEFYVLLERTLVLSLSLAGIRISSTRPREPSTSEGLKGLQGSWYATTTTTTSEQSSQTTHNGLSSSRTSSSTHKVQEGFSQQQNPKQSKGEAHPNGNNFIFKTSGKVGSNALNVPSRTPSSAQTRTHRFHANLLVALDNPDNPLHPILGTDPVRKQLARAKNLRNRWKDADERTAAEILAFEEGERGIMGLRDLPDLLSGIIEGIERAVVIVAQMVDERLKSGGAVGDYTMVLDGETEDVPWEIVEDAMEVD